MPQGRGGGGGGTQFERENNESPLNIAKLDFHGFMHNDEPLKRYLFSCFMLTDL